jgi:hypothetical protein
MASSTKYRRRGKSSKVGRKKQRRYSYSGGKSRSNKKNNKTHKWHQKGCQSGGGSMTGGVAWAPSDLTHQTAGSNIEPYATNGNHYAFNNAGLAAPENTNHLAEKGQIGGKHKHGKKHRKFIGEQHGGMAQLLPELVNMEIRNTLGVPGSVMNSLQGASTGYVSPSATVQPIGKPLQL